MIHLSKKSYHIVYYSSYYLVVADKIKWLSAHLKFKTIAKKYFNKLDIQYATHFIIYNLMTNCQYHMNNMLGLERGVPLWNKKPTGKWLLVNVWQKDHVLNIAPQFDIVHVKRSIYKCFCHKVLYSVDNMESYLNLIVSIKCSQCEMTWICWDLNKNSHK